MYPMPSIGWTFDDDISLGGDVFTDLYNGLVTVTGGCYDLDGFPLFARPNTTIEWQNARSGDSGYGWTFWGYIGFGACQSFWEVINIPLVWGDNDLTFTATSDDRTAQLQTTITKRPGKSSLMYDISNGNHFFSWDESLPGAASFNLYYSTTKDFSKSIPLHYSDDGIAHVSHINSPYVLTGLDEDVVYYFSIVAITEDGVLGVPSDEESYETIKPRVISTFPASSATDVGADVEIIVTFNRDVLDASLDSSTFKLTNDTGSSVPADIHVSGNTATLTPIAPLQSETQYSVQISGTVKDLYNNSMGKAYSWNFKTVDYLGPSIQSNYPGVSKTNIPRNSLISVTFDEPINCNSVGSNAITLTPFIGGVLTCVSPTIQLKLNTLLDSETAYNVYVSAGIEDALGNTSSDYNWSFTTSSGYTWSHTFSLDALYMGNLVKTVDDGSIAVGYTKNSDIYKYWSMKTDLYGNRQWELGASNISANFITHAPDGGYIVVGNVYNAGTLNKSGALIMKLDSNGYPLWQKKYGTYTTNFHSIKLVSTGGYIALGRCENNTGCLLRVNATGDILWKWKYSSSVDVSETSDGDYMLIGAISESHINSSDIWIAKIDLNGAILWQKSYGLPDRDDFGSRIEQTSDGGYIITGYSRYTYFENQTDLMVLKISSSGEIVWQYKFGGDGTELPGDVQQTTDGGFVISGTTDSVGTGAVGDSKDAWLLKLNVNGAPVWQHTYGVANGNESAKSVETTADGSYIIGANSGTKAWIFKTGPDGIIQFNVLSGYQRFDSGVKVLPIDTTPATTNEARSFLTLDVTTIDVPFESLYSDISQQAP
jgi:hypothetical protein